VSAHDFFIYFFNIYFFIIFKKKIKIATCQSDIVPHGKDNVMW